MTERYLRQSPLAQLKLAARATAEPGDAGTRLCERGFLGQLALRGREAPFFQAVAGILGVAPPQAPNSVAEGDDARILWLGPDEWLAVMPEARAETMARTLLEKLNGQFASVVDLSEARAVIGIGGPRARDVLAQGCSLDLHSRAFAMGRCGQTLLAHMPVILHRRGDSRGEAFDIYIQRSLAEHLWLWLEDAAQDYGIAVVEG